MRTVVYTAEIDDRFGAGKVSSRIGLSSPARLYNPQTDLLDDIGPWGVIIATGCDIPSDAKPENVRAMCEAAHGYVKA